jgi:hypothetical protein
MTDLQNSHFEQSSGFVFDTTDFAMHTLAQSTVIAVVQSPSIDEWVEDVKEDED